MDTEDIDQIPDEEQTGDTDIVSPVGESQQSGPSLEELATQVATLKDQNTKAARDFQAAVGRMQALYAKIESGKGDTDKLVQQLAAQMRQVDGALEVVLEDDVLDASVREKVKQARTKATSEHDLASLKAEIESLKTAREAPAVATDDSIRAFEEAIVEEIESYGLSPNDAVFDWTGEASTILKTSGIGATQKYFRSKIKAALEAKLAAERRQERKEAVGVKTTTTGGNTALYDPAASDEENIKRLVALGIKL